MKVNYKLIFFLDIFAWIMLMVFIVSGEVLLLVEPLWAWVGVIALSFIVGLHIYIFCALLKNRKRIALLKEQYIDSLKPEHPLRFCPSDEELVKSHQEQKNNIDEDLSIMEDKQVKTEEKTLNEEEAELV